MRVARQGSLTTRRNFLHHGVSLAGAATLPAGAAATPPNAAVRLAQAGALGAAASAITVKSVRLVGSAINYAYAVKAGPWVFLNGHEAFDFERGLAPEVEGQPGNCLSGRPPLASVLWAARARPGKLSVGMLLSLPLLGIGPRSSFCTAAQTRR